MDQWGSNFLLKLRVFPDEMFRGTQGLVSFYDASSDPQRLAVCLTHTGLSAHLLLRLKELQVILGLLTTLQEESHAGRTGGQRRSKRGESRGQRWSDKGQIEIGGVRALKLPAMG